MKCITIFSNKLRILRRIELDERIIAKMQAGNAAFADDEVCADFLIIYRKFIRRNKDLGDFFLRETKDIVNQLCDEFERSLKSDYPENDAINFAAEP